MKGKFLALAIGAVALAVVGATSTMAGKPDPGEKGNGLPKLSMEDSWLLNVHAYSNCPARAADGTNTRTIFVEAVLSSQVGNHGGTTSSNDINLGSNAGDTFNVVDGNACDDDEAALDVPSDIAENYDIFVKLRGKPGTKLNPVLCGESGSSTYCYTGSTISTRNFGEDRYKDFTKQLLSVQDPGDIHGCAGNYCDLFEAGLDNYFWDWTATDKAKATVVFIPCTDSKIGLDPSQSPCLGYGD